MRKAEKYMSDRSDDRTRSRRKRHNRKKEVAVSWLAILISFAIIAGLAFGGIWLAKQWKGSRQPVALQESSREVIPESIPPEAVSSEAEAETLRAVPDTSGASPKERVKILMEHMSLEDKVAQLFIITPEALTGVDLAHNAGAATQAAIDKYPVGGLVYFSGNLQKPAQVKAMLANSKAFSVMRVGVPVFTSVDEEGGTQVARVAKNPQFQVPKFSDMAEIGASADVNKAYEVGSAIGSYLAELGFNLDYAPVADVWSNPENTVVSKRSFGTDGTAVAGFSNQAVKGLKEQGVEATLKHFPGHGATTGDTHDGYAYTDKTLEQLLSNELIPFQSGIEAGVNFIMAAHIAVPAITGDNTPSSLSKTMITDVLRKQLGYENIVITDSLSMAAVTAQYTSAEATVKALLAGVDILLMPENFIEAYDGVLEAVKTGVISEERINQSLERILRVKVSLDQ